VTDLESLMAEFQVDVKELKTRLSQYLREVKKGRSIVITEHGIPIGQIIPRDTSLQDRNTLLINAGLVERNGEKLQPIQPSTKNRSSRQISKLLVDMRE
jgi:prevent-host-death family protein